MTLRIGAVGYLNARPLVFGLDRQPERFAVRFDVPSQCAALLRDGAIDVGLIPSIEYLRAPAYCIVPDVAIVSDGPVASVALFAGKRMTAIRSIALDESSRTSVALLQILSAERFGIAPEFETMAPDLTAMLRRCDAALLIGDAALFTDPSARGLEKIDLGAEWTAMTGLPFVWAFWAGAPAAIDGGCVSALQAARDAGRAAIDEIAAAYCGGNPERTARGRAYLRENMQYRLGERELAGLGRFHAAACRLGLAPAEAHVRFCGGVAG